MEKLILKDRIVIEIRCQEDIELDNAQLCNIVQFVGHKINLGHKGDAFMDELPNMPKFEVLYEHESKEYGGFRILSDKSLVGQFIYGSEPKPTILDAGEFSVASINRQDLRDFGYDPSKLKDDDMEAIASKMGKAYHEGYCECWGEDLRSAANHYDVPRKEEDDEQAG